MSKDVELLTDLCRLCLKQDETVCNDIEGVLECISNMFRIQIPLEEGLPSNVCNDCIQRLEIANDMRDVCLRSLEYFNKIDDTKIDDNSLTAEAENTYEVAVFECPRCCMCESFFDSVNLLDEHCQNNHGRSLLGSEEEFWCSVCSNDWDSKDELQSHRSCDKCLVAFLDEEELNRHLSEHLTEIVKQELEPEESEYEEETEEYLIEPINDVTTKIRSTKLQGCCHCAEQFKHEQDLFNHFQKLHSKYMFKGERGKYNCRYCKTPFDHKGDLQRHYKLPRVKTYSCKECNIFFITFTKLRAHMEQEHGGFQVFKCDECDKTYDQLSSLRFHKYTIHNTKNRYKCPDCGKLFTRRNMFNEHRNIHLGLRPFKCKDCGASFTSNSSLRSHFRVHTGAKPFACQFCDKAYSHYSDMKRHSYTHTGNYPFQCSVCKKQFGKKSTYRLHLTTHPDQKIAE